MKISRLFPLWKPASFCLLFAAVFFFATYGLANQYAARLYFVPSISYPWEKHIPFLPWTIIPYWSMDLFYGISFFLCRSRRELKIHTLRLLAASAFCCACFILFSLACSAEIPPISNRFFYWLFFASGLVATPFNQAPSLHIALAWLVWLRFAVHTKGWLKMGLGLWFLLIGISVLTCYQHHFIDVPLGLAAGVFISYLLPMQYYKRIVPPGQRTRWKLACLYGSGAVFFACAAWRISGPALVLLWSAAALGIVALGYAVWGTAVFQKGPQGRLSVSARLLLAPYRAGAFLSQRYFMRNIPSCSKITDNLYIGSLPRGASISQAGLLDMTAEFDSSHILCRHKAVCPRMDLTPLSAPQIQQAVEVLLKLLEKGPVLVCCALGLSRSATVAAAYLVHSGRADNIQDAVAILRRIRPAVVLPPVQRTYLIEWAENYTMKKTSTQESL